MTKRYFEIIFSEWRTITFGSDVNIYPSKSLLICENSDYVNALSVDKPRYVKAGTYSIRANIGISDLAYSSTILEIAPVNGGGGGGGTDYTAQNPISIQDAVISLLIAGDLKLTNDGKLTLQLQNNSDYQLLQEQLDNLVSNAFFWVGLADSISREQAVQNPQLLTDFVQSSEGRRPKNGDIIKTNDGYTFAFTLRQGQQGEWQDVSGKDYQQQIGDLTALTTQIKTDLVSALIEVNSRTVLRRLDQGTLPSTSDIPRGSYILVGYRRGN